MISNKKVPISRWFNNKISYTMEQKELKWLFCVLYFPHLNIFESLIFVYNIPQFNLYSGNIKLILKCLWNRFFFFKCIFYFIFLWSVAEGMTALRHFIQTLSKKKLSTFMTVSESRKKKKPWFSKFCLNFSTFFYLNRDLIWKKCFFSFFLFVYLVELRRVNLIQN